MKLEDGDILTVKGVGKFRFDTAPKELDDSGTIITMSKLPLSEKRINLIPRRLMK
jgi:hypothetical protein